MRTSFLLLLLPVLALTACKNKASFERVSTDKEADHYAIHSTGGEVKLGLTDEVVYYRLSDETLARINEGLNEDSSEGGGIGGAIAGAVKSRVSDLLQHQIQYRVDQIEDLRFEDGQFTLAFEDGTTERVQVKSERRGSGINVSSTGENPVFRPEEAQQFIEAFRTVKQDAAMTRRSCRACPGV